MQHPRQFQLSREVPHGIQQRLLLFCLVPLGIEEARAPNRDARLIGCGGQDLEVFVTEGVGLGALHHQHPDGPTIHAQRHIDFRTGIEAGQVPGLAGDVGRVVEPAVLDCLFADALARLHVPVAGCVLPPTRRLEHAIAGGRITQEDAEEVEAQGLIVEAVDHRPIDFLFARRGSNRGGQAQQCSLASRGMVLRCRSCCRLSPSLGSHAPPSARIKPDHGPCNGRGHESRTPRPFLRRLL